MLQEVQSAMHVRFLSFANGDLFFSNAKVFWGIEDALKLKGQGDRLEASSMFHAEKVIGYSLDNQERFVDMGRCHGLVRYDTAEKIPVLCLFAVHSDDCIVFRWQLWHRLVDWITI